MGLCSLGNSWISVCPWKALNEFLGLLCLFVFLLLSQFNWPYLNPLALSQHVSFYTYNSFPSPAGVGVSKQLCGGRLLAGLKPQQ